MIELNPLKRGERVILNYIIEFALKENYLPTIREICNGLGYHSTSSVAHYMDLLQERGLIHRRNGSPSYSVEGLKYQYEK